MMDNRQKTVDFKKSSNETSIIWLRTDGSLLQTGKIDKFIIFCLAQGKSGCVSLKKWEGEGGHGPAAYVNETPLSGYETKKTTAMTYFRML